MRVLRTATLERLGSGLSRPKLILTEDGVLRDWRGLADLANLPFHVKQKLESASDAAQQILTFWGGREAEGFGKAEQNNQAVTVYHFIEALRKMDRHDVLEDCWSVIVSDCRLAKESLSSSSALAPKAPVQPEEYFDAMVVFADEDASFAEHLVLRMESAGLKVFVLQRDLTVGSVEHAAASRIVEKQCDKVVAILSPAFLESPQNLFLTEFAQYVGIRDRSNSKIVPLVLRHCKLPPLLSMYHKIFYDPSRRLVNFWEKLLCRTFGVASPLPESLSSYEFFLDDSPKTLADDVNKNTTELAAQAKHGRPRYNTVPSSPSLDRLSLDSTSTTLTTLNDTITTYRIRTASQQNRHAYPTYSGSQSSLVDRLPDPPKEDPSSLHSPSRSPFQKFKDKLKMGPGSKSKKKATRERATTAATDN